MKKMRAKPHYVGLYPEHVIMLNEVKETTGIKSISGVFQLILTDFWTRLQKESDN